MTKSVQFYRFVAVRRVLCLEDYTDEEMGSCWVTEAEAQASAQDTSSILRHLQSTDRPQDVCCTRGLEKRHGEALRRRRQRKRRAYQILQTVQEDVSLPQEQVSDFLAQTLATASGEARLEAHDQGLMDHMAAMHPEQVCGHDKEQECLLAPSKRLAAESILRPPPTASVLYFAACA